MLVLISQILSSCLFVHSFLLPHRRTIPFTFFFPYVSTEVITHFVRMVVISKIEDYDSAWGLISLSRCILSKRDTVFNANVPPYSEEGRHG